MFAAVLVASYDTAAHFAVIRILTISVQLGRVAIQPLDSLFCDRAVVAQPNWAGQHQYVGGLDFFVQLAPLVGLPAVFEHVGIHASGNVMVNWPDNFGLHTMLLHNTG